MWFKDGLIVDVDRRFQIHGWFSAEDLCSKTRPNDCVEECSQRSQLKGGVRQLWFTPWDSPTALRWRASPWSCWLYTPQCKNCGGLRDWNSTLWKVIQERSITNMNSAAEIWLWSLLPNYAEFTSGICPKSADSHYFTFYRPHWTELRLNYSVCREAFVLSRRKDTNLVYMSHS